MLCTYPSTSTFIYVDTCLTLYGEHCYICLYTPSLYTPCVSFFFLEDAIVLHKVFWLSLFSCGGKCNTNTRYEMITLQHYIVYNGLGVFCVFPQPSSCRAYSSSLLLLCSLPPLPPPSLQPIPPPSFSAAYSSSSPVFTSGRASHSYRSSVAMRRVPGLLSGSEKDSVGPSLDVRRVAMRGLMTGSPLECRPHPAVCVCVGGCR